MTTKIHEAAAEALTGPNFDDTCDSYFEPEGGGFAVDAGGGLVSIPALVRRRDAAQDALDSWRPRKWRMGEHDCLRMFARHARKLGHRVKIPPARSYRTVRGALRKLEEWGQPTLPDFIDSLGFERIAPAAAIVGDLLQLPSEDPRLPALTVALGNGRVVGWHEAIPHGGADVLEPLEFVTAWRIDPE